MGRLTISMLLAVGLAGCGGSGTVHVDTTLAQSAALTNASQAGSTLTLPGDTLVIERVRIAVSEVELEGKDEGDAEFEMGARIVGVALDGSPTEVAVESVPEGSYETLGLELTRNSGDFGTPAASILVEGSWEGSAFEYRSDVAPELEFHLDAPAVVKDGGDARISITFDVAAWFLDASGAALDPTDAANRDTIESSIRSSMAAHAEVEDGEDDDDDAE